MPNCIICKFWLNSLYFFCELEQNQEFSSEAVTLSCLFYLGFAKFRINLSKKKFYLQFFIILNDLTTVYTGQRSFYIAYEDTTFLFLNTVCENIIYAPVKVLYLHSFFIFGLLKKTCWCRQKNLPVQQCVYLRWNSTEVSFWSLCCLSKIINTKHNCKADIFIYSNCCKAGWGNLKLLQSQFGEKCFVSFYF